MNCPDKKLILIFCADKLPESIGLVDKINLIDHILKCRKCNELYMQEKIPIRLKTLH